MQTDLFASKTEATFIREHRGELSRPPSRSWTLATAAHKAEMKDKFENPELSPGLEYVWVPEKLKWIHFVFARVHKYPPARRRTIEPWPSADKFCFMNRGLAYQKFDDKKQIDAWFTKTGGTNKPYKVWTCVFCKKLHQIPFPIDDSTSGKTPRIWAFLIAHGHSPEEVYGLTTEK